MAATPEILVAGGGIGGAVLAKVMAERGHRVLVVERERQFKDRVREFLSNTEVLPRELLFIGRNMNIVRATNKLLGSPVNRIKVMADWAVRAIEVRRGRGPWSSVPVTV